MPSYEDDIPKLAEISRTISDFRNEFRDTVGKMVRSDVYLADLRTIEVRLSALSQENQRLSEQLKDDRNDRRSLRNITLTAVAGTVISIIGTVVGIMLK